MIFSVQPTGTEIFRSLFHGSKEAEAFVFFTDPHLFQKGECGEEEMLKSRNPKLRINIYI